MSTENLKLDLLRCRIVEEAGHCSSDTLTEICTVFPSISQEDAKKLYAFVSAASFRQTEDKSAVVITAPPSFSIKAKSTKNTVAALLHDACSSILITGYSLSDYFDELLDCIIEKSQRGILVRFFVNHIESQSNMDKLLRYKGRFLKIYDYPKQSKDKISALHAKVISIDGEKTLITSANLSYHGQVGNIELGTLVKSRMFAKELDDIFTKLLFSKVFVEI